MNAPSQRWATVDALLVAGDYADAARAIEQVEAEHAEDWTAADQVQAHIRLANLVHKQGHYDRVLEQVRLGLALQRLALQRPALAGAMAELRAWAALARVCTGKLEQAQEEIDQGWALLEGADDACETACRGRVLLHRAVGNLRAVEGRLREAVEACEAALQGADRIACEWEKSIARFNLADAYARLGQHPAALEHLERAREEKSAIGDRWGLAHVQAVKVEIHLDRHEYEAGKTEVMQGLDLASQLGDPKLVAMLEVLLGRLTYRIGDIDEAHRIATEAQQRAQRGGARVEQLQAGILLGFVALARGEFDDAVQRADAVLRSAEDGQIYGELAASQRLAALALARAGRIDDARAALEFAVPLIKTLGNPYRRLEMEVARIEVEMRAGSPADQLLQRITAAARRTEALAATWQRELLERLHAQVRQGSVEPVSSE